MSIWLEPPLLSSEKNFVHCHFCYWYNVAQYCQCHIRAEAAHSAYSGLTAGRVTVQVCP